MNFVIQVEGENWHAPITVWKTTIGDNKIIVFPTMYAEKLWSYDILGPEDREGQREILWCHDNFECFTDAMRQAIRACKAKIWEESNKGE